MAGKGIPELLNYKQKGKDLNEFIKVPLSEKLAYCFGDPALTLMYYRPDSFQVWKSQNLDLKTCGSLCAGSGAFVHHAANGKYGKDHLCFCYL